MIKDLAQKGFVSFGIPSAREIETCFDSLLVDPYYGEYRYKAVSRFNLINGKVVMLPHADFFQSKAYNPVAGNITRRYPPVDDRVVNSHYLPDVFKKISEQIQVHPETCFTVHQIRVVTSENQEGPVAAEGIHQDGYDFVAI